MSLGSERPAPLYTSFLSSPQTRTCSLYIHTVLTLLLTPSLFIPLVQCQAEQAEKQIKEEFEKLHQFLREEEESRRAAVREEKEEKRGKLEEWIEQELQSISDQLMEVEEEVEGDDVTFLLVIHG